MTSFRGVNAEVGTAILRTLALADGNATRDVVLAVTSSGERSGRFSAGTIPTSVKPNLTSWRHSRVLTASLGLVASSATGITREAAQPVAGSSGSALGSEGSRDCRHETVMSTDDEFGAIRLVFSPDVAICRTPCGGVTLTRLAFPVKSALTTIW